MTSPQPKDAWASAMNNIGADQGFFRQLDAEHKALFVEGGDILVVTFDNLDDARQHPEDRMPWGVKFIAAQGWSALGIGAHGWTWYRAQAVLDFFDELRDSGFFARFRKVVFYGTSMAGYAACAFSSAVPGSIVIALSPQATLDRDITGGWEKRFRGAWRRDFSGRYGYAPDQVACAKAVWLFHDPFEREDAVHAALFRGPNIHPIRCRHLGHNMATMLTKMSVLKPIVCGLVAEDLTEAQVYHHLRARRRLPLYQKALLTRLLQSRRQGLVYGYTQAVLRDSLPVKRPVFLNHFLAAAKALGRTGHPPGL
ncbi:phosphoadenosine phosphosulfate reductase [Thioclava sp. GXIMD4216]|uniref:phosphoadenosine phosphosulfate reductase n=1 Tax=Thioclava sp. GXIMD4216 TaxID=3131929 RepID=UPI0030CC166F